MTTEIRSAIRTIQKHSGGLPVGQRKDGAWVIEWPATPGPTMTYVKDEAGLLELAHQLRHPRKSYTA